MLAYMNTVYATPVHRPMQNAVVKHKNKCTCLTSFHAVFWPLTKSTNGTEKDEK
jgi:hypothetical protein